MPLKDYLSYGDNRMIQAKLAKAVLAEVPQQFLSYMRKHGIQPPQQRINVQSLSALPMPQPEVPPMPAHPM